RYAFPLAVVGMFVVLSALDAGAVPALKPLMLERGKLLFQDDFTKAPGKEWHKGKGKWEAVDGVVRASELADDMLAAVKRHLMDFDSVIIQYEFRFDGTPRATSLSINGAGGHVCRVQIRPTGFSVNKDKDKKKGTPGVVLDSRDVAIKPGEWHTLLVEL